MNAAMTLTFELNSDNVKVNQQAKYLGQRSITVWTHRHITLIALSGLLKWSAMRLMTAFELAFSGGKAVVLVL